MVLPLVVCTLVVLGCGSGGGAESGGAGNAMSREAVDDTTVSMLVQSQRALKQGALRNALTLADSVVRRAPRLADGHFQRGRVLSELKRFDDAAKEYRKVLSLNPQYQGAWFNLGNNAYRRQNFEKALRYFQNEQEQFSSASTLVEVGKAYSAVGKPDSAQWAYEQALSLDSTTAAAHARLGRLFEEEGTVETALTHSRRALELEPENVNYQYVVASHLYQLGQYEDAITHLRSVIEERPWHQEAHYNLGQALVRTGQKEKGKQYLVQADTLDKRQREIERLESVAKDQPGNPQRWKTLADAYRDIGRLGKAQETYSIALYLRPSSPTLRDQLAQLAAARGNYKAAVTHYQALLRRHPDFTDGWFNLGVVYARNGETEKARKMWKRVLQQRPNHPRARKYLSSLEAGDS